MPESNQKKARHRSPAYPSLSLPDAIERASVLYNEDRLNFFTPEVANKHWGYDKDSAIGMRAIAALKQYGLLEERRTNLDRELKISTLGIDLLLPEEKGSLDHKDHLVQAATAPEIFRDILLRHSDQDLPSDRNLERYLIKEKNFNPGSVGVVIRVFRDTVSFAGLDKTDKIDEVTDADSKVDVHVSKAPHDSAKQKDFQSTGSQKMLELPITLPSLCVATVRVPSSMSEMDFNIFISTITGWKTALTQKPTIENLEKDTI